MIGMATASLHALLEPVRALAPALLSQAEEPHAELMALVWGPRFDREHARALLARSTVSAQAAARILEQAAAGYDTLAAAQQGRVRRLIQRHHRQWENAAHETAPPCTAYC